MSEVQPLSAEAPRCSRQRCAVVMAMFLVLVNLTGITGADTDVDINIHAADRLMAVDAWSSTATTTLSATSTRSVPSTPTPINVAPMPRTMHAATISLTSHEASLPVPNCASVDTCLSNTWCRQCLEAINTSADSVHTDAEWNELSLTQMKQVDTTIIRAFLFNPACVKIGSASRGVRKILLDTLGALGAAGSMHTYHHMCQTNQTLVPKCTQQYRMAVGPCAQTAFMFCQPGSPPHTVTDLLPTTDDNNNSFACFSEIFAINATNDSLHEAFRSRACQDYTLNQGLLLGGVAEDGSDSTEILGCAAFPTCSYLKHVCSSSSECAPCLVALERGNGTRAAQLCPYNKSRERAVYNMSTVNDLLDSLVTSCSAGTHEACDYWQARCANNFECAHCSLDMGNGHNAESFIVDSCKSAIEGRGFGGAYAARYLQNIAQACPGISACRRTFSQCVLQFPTASTSSGCNCTACITTTPAGQLPEYCNRLLPLFQFDIVCRACPESVYVVTFPPSSQLVLSQP